MVAESNEAAVSCEAVVIAYTVSPWKISVLNEVMILLDGPGVSCRGSTPAMLSEVDSRRISVAVTFQERVCNRHSAPLSGLSKSKDSRVLP